MIIEINNTTLPMIASFMTGVVLTELYHMFDKLFPVHRDDKK